MIPRQRMPYKREEWRAGCLAIRSRRSGLTKGYRPGPNPTADQEVFQAAVGQLRGGEPTPDVTTETGPAEMAGQQAPTQEQLFK